LEVSGQLHAPAALALGKEPSDTHWIGGWVGPRAGLDDVEKRKFLTLPGLELDPSVVQPVASRYTDYSILALPRGVRMLMGFAGSLNDDNFLNVTK
jgi:hypothetical protein